LEDKRKHKRYDQLGLLYLKVNIGSNTGPDLSRNDTVVCFINNISRSGIGGRALSPLNAGDRVVVKRVKLLNCNIKCEIPATVKWTKTFYKKQRIGISLEGEIPHHLRLDQIRIQRS
jgi:hypothetical protein